MPKKIYRIKLTNEERQELRQVSDAPRAAKERRKRANVLLMADEGVLGPGFKDADIAAALGCTVRTVERVRAACHSVGPGAAIERKKRAQPPRSRVLDGRGEAELVKIACSTPPTGHAKWSLRMLADRLVELRVVDSISHEAVRGTLKKTPSNPGS